MRGEPVVPRAALTGPDRCIPEIGPLNASIVDRLE
jgi:hypothetical protein